jgi:hypothetical protein
MSGAEMTSVGQGIFSILFYCFVGWLCFYGLVLLRYYSKKQIYSFFGWNLKQTRQTRAKQTKVETEKPEKVVKVKQEKEKVKNAYDLSPDKLNLRNDVISAMVNLGFPKKAATVPADYYISQGIDDFDTLVKECLKSLT